MKTNCSQKSKTEKVSTDRLVMSQFSDTPLYHINNNEHIVGTSRNRFSPQSGSCKLCSLTAHHWLHCTLRSKQVSHWSEMPSQPCRSQGGTYDINIKHLCIKSIKSNQSRHTKELDSTLSGLK